MSVSTDRATSIIFDVGNVLFHWDICRLYRPLIADEAELQRFVTEVVTPQWHFQHDAGRPFAETKLELIAKFPEYEELISVFGPRFSETVGPEVTGMRSLIRTLDDRKIPLFGLTNFSGEFWKDFHATESGFFEPFRDILVSGDEKLMKPDPAIYALAISRFGVDPKTCLFVDDRAENVEVALDAGLLAHQFIDAETLQSALTKFELL